LKPTRLKVTSRSGFMVKKIQLIGTDGASYTAEVDATGVAALTAPAGCPLDIYGYDDRGGKVGPIRLSIQDPNNPPPFDLP
jgi:hypothetical protein